MASNDRNYSIDAAGIAISVGAAVLIESGQIIVGWALVSLGLAIFTRQWWLGRKTTESPLLPPPPDVTGHVENYHRVIPGTRDSVAVIGFAIVNRSQGANAPSIRVVAQVEFVDIQNRKVSRMGRWIDQNLASAPYHEAVEIPAGATRYLDLATRPINRTEACWWALDPVSPSYFYLDPEHRLKPPVVVTVHLKGTVDLKWIVSFRNDEPRGGSLALPGWSVSSAPALSNSGRG